MKIGIIVGHNERQQGADAPVWGRSEFNLNSEVARLMVATRDYENDFELKVFTRKYVGSTGREIRTVYAEADNWGADLTIELHYNSYQSDSTGTETLSSGSSGSLAFAKDVQAVMLETLQLRDRGVKTIRSGDGAVNLSSGRTPAILVEPFFGSNPSDTRKAMELGAVGFAQMYLAGIRRYLGVEKATAVPALPPVNVIEPVQESGWVISTDDSKSEFVRRNLDAIDSLIGRVNGWIAGKVALDEINPLTLDDFVALTSAEAAISRDGTINVNATHSNGEEGLFPLPDNLAFWIGAGWEVETAEGNITAFAHYLGALKNSKVIVAGSTVQYRELFDHGAFTKMNQARVLAAAVHGSFYAPNFAVDMPEGTPQFLAYFAAMSPAVFVAVMTEMEFKSSRALTGRMENLAAAEKWLREIS